MQRAIDILKNPAFWMFLSAVVLIHAFMNPLNLASWGGFIRVVFIVSIAAVSYVACHVCVLYLHIRFTPARKTVVYYPFLWIFPIVALVCALVIWLAPMLETYSIPNFDHYSTVFSVTLIRLVVFEWLFYRFFVSIIEQRGATQDIETVTLGDHTVKVVQILYVQAMEHRVCINTKQGELVERSRFRDLMRILEGIDGVQPHRSYWVPTHAVLHLQGDADRLNIVLTSGDKIAVARTRRSEIEDWAKEKNLLIRVAD